MKNFVLSIILSCLTLCGFAQVTGTMYIGGAESSFDTLVHRRIGPGMTYTKVYFGNAGIENYRMLVNVVTIDVTNPYNSQTSYMANDGFYMSHSQMTEYLQQLRAGKNPVATMMGGAFVQVNSVDPFYPAWEVSGGLVSDGRLLLNPSGLCYYLDSDNNAVCGNVSLSAVVETSKGSFSIGSINRVRGRSRGVTMFCNNYAQTRDWDNTLGSEVLLSLVGANEVGTNGTYICKVEQHMAGSGHSFNSNQIVLSANGDAEAYLEALEIGEEVSLKITCTDALGQVISIMQSSSPLFGYGVREGMAQPNATMAYAQCAVGVSKDGKTVYWFDLENNASSTAPVIMLNEYMANTGVWNAILMDGGPSAEMTVLGTWATQNSVGGDFNGRNVPCGLIAYCKSPYDNDVVSVEFETVKTVMVKGDKITPSLYGYNQYGELITSTAEANPAVYLTCDASMGEISADGKSFTSTTGKSGYLYAHVTGSDIVGKMWIDANSWQDMRVEPKFFFTEEGRGTGARLFLINPDGSEDSLASKDATWSTTDKWVCSVDADGVLYPYEENNGEDVYVIAEFRGMKDSIAVVVQNSPKEDEVQLANMIESLDDINMALQGIPTSFYVKVAVEPGTAPAITIIYNKGEGRYEERLKVDSQDESFAYAYVGLDDAAIEGYPVVIEKIETDGSPVRLEALTAYYRGATPDIPSDPSAVISAATASLGVAVFRKASGIVLDASSLPVGAVAECSLWTLKGERLTGDVIVRQNDGAVTVGVAKSGTILLLVKVAGKKFVYKI